MQSKQHTTRQIFVYRCSVKRFSEIVSSEARVELTVYVVPLQSQREVDDEGDVGGLHSINLIKLLPVGEFSLHLPLRSCQ